MSEYRELLIGCGRERKKHRWVEGREQWQNLTTLDVNPEVCPDVIHDLCDLPLPFDDDFFDEIHAYEVLEHTGQQGDYRFFFAQFSEFWRIMKPDGKLFGSSPALKSRWLWGDPGHTRVITEDTLVFLSQTAYETNAETEPMTDYRNIYKADFRRSYLKVNSGTFWYVLRAEKPSYASGRG